MPIREPVVRLLRGLGAENPQVLENALINVYLVLDQTRRYQQAEELRSNESERRLVDRERPVGWLAQYLGDIHKEFSALLLAEYVDLVLTEDEVDALTEPTVALLDRSPSLASRVATALGPTLKIDVVPRLASLVWTYAGTNGQVVNSAIRSIQRILASLDQPGSMAPNEQAIVADAFAAFRYAASVGVHNDLWDIPRAAAMALGSLTERFDLES